MLLRPVRAGQNPQGSVILGRRGAIHHDLQPVVRQLARPGAVCVPAMLSVVLAEPQPRPCCLRHWHAELRPMELTARPQAVVTEQLLRSACKLDISQTQRHALKSSSRSPSDSSVTESCCSPEIRPSATSSSVRARLSSTTCVTSPATTHTPSENTPGNPAVVAPAVVAPWQLWRVLHRQL